MTNAQFLTLLLAALGGQFYCISGRIDRVRDDVKVFSATEEAREPDRLDKASDPLSFAATASSRTS